MKAPPERGPRQAKHDRNLTLWLGGLAAATIVLGFLIQWLVLTILGPGADTDALFAALAVPQLAIVVLSNPLANVLVPLLARANGAELGADIWAVFLSTLALFLGLGLVLGLLAPVWGPLLVPGFGPPAKRLMVALTQVQLLGMALMGTAAVLRSAYQARHHFIWAALSAVLAAGLTLAFLAWGLPRLGVIAAAWGFTLRSALELVLLLPVLGRFRQPAWHTPLLPSAWRRIRPLVLGSAYDRTEILLDRFLTSLAPAGGLSLYYLAQQIYGAVGQVVNRAVTVPLTPRLAQLAHRGGDWHGFEVLYRRRMVWIGGVCIAVLVALLLIGEPALRVVFGVRNVTAADVHALWWIMIALFGALVGDIMGNLLNTSFYAADDMMTPTKIGVVVFTLGALFKLGGFFGWGIIGIAGATTAYYAVRVGALYVALRGKVADGRALALQAGRE